MQLQSERMKWLESLAEGDALCLNGDNRYESSPKEQNMTIEHVIKPGLYIASKDGNEENPLVINALRLFNEGWKGKE